MTGARDDDARAWAAEKRDFVADSRDEAIDERDIAAETRDVVAGTRDAVADEREAQLDAWQAQLEKRAQALGLSVRNSAQRADRVEAGQERTRAEEERADADSERETAKADREAATHRRQVEAHSTLLALAFADIAENLYDAETYEDVLTRIAEAAVATVAGSTMATVTLREGGVYRTAASTDLSATAVDEGQYKAGEGPSLDAFTVGVVDVPSFPDARWPILATGPSNHGVESSLSYNLQRSNGHGAENGTAALNIYASDPAAFDQAAREIGFVLAAHASLAARAVGERVTLEGIGSHLEQALLSRDVIGQAKGILMERLKATPEEAFDILRRSSTRLNVKLREIARQLTETGDIPGRS